MSSPAAKLSETECPAKVTIHICDWTIERFSMLKPLPDVIKSPPAYVDSSDKMQWSISLSPKLDGNFRIEVCLVCSTLESYLNLCHRDINLSFLDGSGNVLDNSAWKLFEDISSEEKKMFILAKEGKIPKYLGKDSLTIQARLCLRYRVPDVKPIPDTSSPPQSKSLKELSNDMRDFFLMDRECFADVKIKVGKRVFFAHRAILHSRSPFFARMLDEKIIKKEEIPPLDVLPDSDSCEPKTSEEKNLDIVEFENEDPDVFQPLLTHVYCGCLMLPKPKDDYTLYTYAEKYGLRELSHQLCPTKMSIRSLVEHEKIFYTWHVRNFSSRKSGDFCPIYSPYFKTRLAATITWKLALFFFDNENIHLSLQRVDGLDVEIQTMFKLSILKPNGTPYESRKFCQLFVANPVPHFHPGFLDPSARFVIEAEYLSDDILTVSADLTISVGKIVSEIDNICMDTCPEIDLNYLSKNFTALLDSEVFSDITLRVGDSSFRVHKVILSARSLVFARMFENEMAEKITGYVDITDIDEAVMRLLISYIYTAEVKDLAMNNALDLYQAADKYEIFDLKNKCSQFMQSNMDVINACEILILANMHEDTQLKAIAREFISRRAGQALLTTGGRNLIMDYPDLAADILESLSAAYCALSSSIFDPVAPDKTTAETKEFIAVVHDP